MQFVFVLQRAVTHCKRDEENPPYHILSQSCNLWRTCLATLCLWAAPTIVASALFLRIPGATNVTFFHVAGCHAKYRVLALLIFATVIGAWANCKLHLCTIRILANSSTLHAWFEAFFHVLSSAIFRDCLQWMSCWKWNNDMGRVMWDIQLW